MGGDVYMGGAMNFLYGITDELLYDSNNCSIFTWTKGLFVFPEGFATTFIYSEYQILNTVIPALELIGDYASADAVAGNCRSQQTKPAKEAVFSKNLSFDSGVTYSKNRKRQKYKVSPTTTSWTQSFSGGFLRRIWCCG
jgi:hypothetical protein